MDEFYKELDPAVADSITSQLSAQERSVFDKIIEADWRLTQHNFLVNAGGSAAIFGYMGTQSPPQFLVWSLVCFIIGVIVSGFEIRALLKFYSLLHKDILKRSLGFSENQLRVRELNVTENLGKWAIRLNHWCGWVSQICFVLGVGTGLAFHVWSLLKG